MTLPFPKNFPETRCKLGITCQVRGSRDVFVCLLINAFSCMVRARTKQFTATVFSSVYS